jgi:asparagine synthase (glutamine-hydrolysing)
MCGITLSYDRDLIREISHRGISSNVLRIPGCPLYLEHVLLPFQTTAESGIQPKKVKDGVYLLYVGEIFNYRNLRLNALFDSNSDTEYLVNFFGEYSTFEKIISEPSLDEINNWDGFWAIVLVNTNYDQIICFTDPLGKKQLYRDNSGQISSEISGLRKFNIDKNNLHLLDNRYISTIKKFGYNVDNRTPHIDIKRLMPNAIYCFDPNRREKMSCYNEYFNFQLYQNDLDCSLIGTLKNAVESRLISKNYPVSCLVSGGLDSSIIAYLLSSASDRIEYFTIENGEDGKYIDILEKSLGITIKRLEIEGDPKKDLISAFKANQTPIDLGSVLPQYQLFRAVKKAGHSLCITGDGADELFGGYKRILEYDSQLSDIFDELPFYHLPRLVRLSSKFAIEVRCPFLSHGLVKMQTDVEYRNRLSKSQLKNVFGKYLPTEIIQRPKIPLRSEEYSKDKRNYQLYWIKMFETGEIWDGPGIY